MKNGIALTLALAIAAALSANLADAAQPTEAEYAMALRKQVEAQGPMLLGNLRQARDQGLRGDPWGMAFSLQQARRLLDAMVAAEELKPPHPPVPAGTRPGRPGASGERAPLDQPVDVDSPLPGGRWHQLGEVDEVAGSIPVRPVREAIDRALGALDREPLDMDLALVATNQALMQIHWRPVLADPTWVRARDLTIQAYALSLRQPPAAVARLLQARELLVGLPDGKPYADRIGSLIGSGAPDWPKLPVLVRDLDNQVQKLRDAQTRAEMGGPAPKVPEGARR